MRALSALELLGVWERGEAQSQVQRALTLLAAACPESLPDTLAQMNIGQRDACLLTLREWTFGPQLVGLASCPECGQRLELVFDAADIRAGQSAEAGKEQLLKAGGYEINFRLPNSTDLVAVSDRDLETARKLLLARCMHSIHRDKEELAFDCLPGEVADRVVRQMALADPLADVQLNLTCPACSHAWQAAFDIVSFFWSELSAWAYRTMREVHSLASVYGWSEAEILALSPFRRLCYLEMAGG